MEDSHLKLEEAIRISGNCKTSGGSLTESAERKTK